MKLLKKIVTSTVLVYIMVAVLLLIFQRNFLYFPSDAVNHNYTTQKLLSGKAELNIIVLNPGKKSAILYFGGNGESTVTNAVNFKQVFPEHTIYLNNYRGYGGSSGNPTEENLYKDSQLLFDRVCVKHNDCSVIGRSLGSGVATYLAVTRKVNKLVLITPYDSIESIAQEQYPMFPISFILLDKYDSISQVNNIHIATLIILAESDNVIPAKHSRLLINAFDPDIVSVRVIENTGHNNVSNTVQYYELLDEFL